MSPTLYNLNVSPHCYRVRLLASIIGVKLTIQDLDLQKGENLQPWYLEVNPFHAVPALKDGDFIIRDSHAICYYLLTKYTKGTQWFPEDPAVQAQILSWLFTSAGDLTAKVGCSALIGYGIVKTTDPAFFKTGANATLKTIDTVLAKRDWLVGSAASAADVAVYPYIGSIEAGGLSLADYPHLAAWAKRVEALPNFITKV